jgi:hypothetical protein
MLAAHSNIFCLSCLGRERKARDAARRALKLGRGGKRGAAAVCARLCYQRFYPDHLSVQSYDL